MALAMVTLVFAGAVPPAAAQEPPDSVLRAQLRVLQARVDSLSALVAALQAAGRTEEAADAAAGLRAAAEAAAAAGGGAAAAPESAQNAPGLQRSLQALNPEISVTGDLLALAREGGAGEDSFAAREFEISFVSALDPFSRAKIFVAHHSGGGEVSVFADEAEGGEGEEEGDHGHEGAETEVEEGYLEWVNLPGGFGATVGKFRQQVGTYNRWHAHSLPWQGLPLPYSTYLGEEGLAQTGIGLRWLLPLPGAGAYEVAIQGTRASSHELFGESGDLNFLGHVNAFWDLSQSTYLELSASGITGKFVEEDEEFTNRFLHMEAGIGWRPPARALYREANIRGAVMWRAPDVVGADAAMGAFLTTEVRLGRQILTGLRYDYVEDPADPSTSAWLLAPTLTWWQSEFVRIRAEYDHLGGDVESFGQFLIQFTFAMGPHKHENY